MRDAVVSQSSLSISRKTTEQLFGTGRYWLFAACFSKSRDQLSQWRAYGSKIGVSIGFDRAHLAELSKKQNATLRDCRYLAAQMGTGDEYATDIANRLLKTGLLDLSGNFTDPASARSLQQDVLNLAAFIKHASFEEEREIRLLKPKENAQMSPFLFKSTDQTLSPFITIDIDSRRVLDGRKPRFGNCLGILEILVWPSEADEQVLDAISMLFAPTGGVTVRRSDSPYRI